MKKIIIALSLVACSLATHAQTDNTPKFNFKDGETFDFGTIPEGPAAEHTFAFSNVGNSPLIITNAVGSCSCTIANFTREPVLPGKRGAISASMNTKGRPGAFMKDVYVQSNAMKGNERYILHIKGVVEAAK